MVRYPRDERGSVGDLENLRIRTPDGGEVPFGLVAQMELGRGFASIQRVDLNRSVNVTASVDPQVSSASEVICRPRGTRASGTAGDVADMFATFVTLLLVPIACLILDDLQRLPRRLLALPGVVPK